jgi:DNA replication protein DnaC
MEPKKFLVIIGPPGVGKTYICSAMLEDFPKGNLTVRAYSERKLFEKLREGINSNQGDYLTNLHYLIDDDLIILDDVGSSGHNAWREEVLMEFIDFRYKDGKKTVITSNLSIDLFKGVYGERITSRLFAAENSIVSLFGMPDLRQEGL